MTHHHHQSSSSRWFSYKGAVSWYAQHRLCEGHREVGIPGGDIAMLLPGLGTHFVQVREVDHTCQKTPIIEMFEPT